MGAEKRQQNIAIESKLFSHWHNFSFFSAVTLLETFSRDKARLGETPYPSREAVRFTVKSGLDFPASEISSLEAPAEDEGGPSTMEVTFMGLIGPSGLLPHWYDDLVSARVRENDYSLKAFLDIFHHRFITLFYQAWKKHQFTVNFMPDAQDRLSGYLLSLCGLGTSGLSNRIGFKRETLPFYCGLFSRRVPSGETIRTAVEHFSGNKTEIEEFIQHLVPLNEADRTRIGSVNASLGNDTICGSHIWDCEIKFHLRIGAMGFKEFVRFLPSGDLHKPIFSLVRYLAGIEYEFDIEIVLEREEVPLCILGGDSRQKAMLGWTTWLKSGKTIMERDPSVVFHEQ